jgi:hypothetical protein
VPDLFILYPFSIDCKACDQAHQAGGQGKPAQNLGRHGQDFVLKDFNSKDEVER